jgi:glycosyltransferase involved in cell wall biosynthesis
MKRAFGLAPLLIQDGHQVSIVFEDTIDNKKAAAEAPGLRGLRYRASRSCFSVRSRKEKIVSSEQFDVVHICGLGWRNALRPDRLRCGLAIMDHVEIESTLTDTTRVRRWLQAQLESWSLATYPAHIGASRYLETWLRHRLFLKKQMPDVLWLSYANDFEGLSPSVGDLTATKDLYGEKKLLLYFGSFYRQYGCWELLEAAKRIAAMRSDFVLVLAGRGPEQNACEHFVRANGLGERVRFPGYLTGDRALAHLHLSHASVVPLSDTETDWARSPGKLFICMTSRRPIVTAPIGEAKDCFSTSEFFYDASRPETMCAALSKALDTPSGWIANYQPDFHTWRKRVNSWLRWVEPRFLPK